MSGFWIPLLAGAATGVLSAWGIGGGTLLLLVMTLLLGVEPRTAQGINLLYFLPTAGMGLLYHRKNGLLDRELLRRTVPWGLLAAAGGALLASIIDVTLLGSACCFLQKKGDTLFEGGVSPRAANSVRLFLQTTPGRMILPGVVINISYSAISFRYRARASFQSGSGVKPFAVSLLLSRRLLKGRAALDTPYSAVVTGCTFVARPA